MQVLNPSDADRSQHDAEATIVPAEAGPENRLPEYPARALAAGCGQGRVAVRVHIGTDGRVQLQGEVPGRPVSSDACHQEFAAAAHDAVSRWGFFPAMRRVCGDGASECTNMPIAIYLDLEFLFEVVDGKGRVRAQ